MAPGFRGVITLELANVGTAPVVLRPGVRIAQIIFHRSQKHDIYQGRYKFPTEPEAGKIHLDDDLKFWVPKADLEPTPLVSTEAGDMPDPLPVV